MKSLHDKEIQIPVTNRKSFDFFNWNKYIVQIQIHLTFVSKSKPKFVKKGTGNPFF